MQTSDQERYLRAKERVRLVKEFYSNATAYVIIIPLLVYLNYRTTSFPWSIFPAVGWGIGLVGHYMAATGRNPILGKDWEDRKIREFMNREDF
ncbi:MAG: 2TM domain-containing protein [Allomuricauda sp.]